MHRRTGAGLGAKRCRAPGGRYRRAVGIERDYVHLVATASANLLPICGSGIGFLVCRRPRVVVETQDGMRLGGWYFPHTSGGSGPAVLVCNGNAGDRSCVRSWLSRCMAWACRCCCLTIAATAVAGRPSEQGLAADARRPRRSGCPASRRPRAHCYFGESLGAAVAVRAGRATAAGGLVLRSPFTSLAEVGAVHYPWLPLRRFAAGPLPVDRAHRLCTRRCWSSWAAATTSSPATLSERLVAAARRA